MKTPEIDGYYFHCKDCNNFNLCEYYHHRKGQSKICSHFESDKQCDIELYKKALEYLDELLFDHCRYSLECNIHCEHEFHRCDSLKKGGWAKLALKKAREQGNDS